MIFCCFYFFVKVCLYQLLCSSISACSCMHMCSYGGMTLVSDIFLNCSPSQSLKQILSLNLMLTNLSRWTDWKYHGSIISSSPTLLIQICTTVPNFYMSCTNHIQRCLFCSHQLTNRAIFPVAKKYFPVTFGGIKYISVIHDILLFKSTQGICSSYNCILAHMDE